MIVSPYIFSQVKRESFFSYSPFGGQSSLEVAPKSFKAVYVAALAIAVFALTMFYESVDIAFGSDAGITVKGVGTHNRTTLNPATYKRNKRFGLNIGDHLGPYFAASAEDAEDWGLPSAPAAQGASGLLGLALVSPLATEIGLVDLDDAAENLGNIEGHYLPYEEKSTQNTPAFKTNFKGYIMSWKPFKKRHQNGVPSR